MLKLTNLSIGYGKQPVAQRLHATAQEGEMIALLGKNGSGKSTLLRTLAGLQNALSGTLELSQSRNQEKAIARDLTVLSPAERAKLVALCLTEKDSLDETTVRQIVAMGRYPYTSFLGGLTLEDEQVIDEAMLQTGVQDKAEQYFNRLSDGEKQCVLLAKALAQQTPIILLDEPTAHLDLPNRIKTMLLLRQMAHEQHKTVIISTHELDLAQQVADTVWLMNNGQLLTGKADQLIQSGAFEQAFQMHFPIDLSKSI